MTAKTTLVPSERIQQVILLIRGQKVILDTDLSQLYGVETKTLNRAVKRNIVRFPEDFMIQLTKKEYEALRYHFGTLKSGKGQHRKYLPYAFTEQGVAMLSSVLNSQKAIQVNMEKQYDSQFKIVFDAIRQLMSPPANHNRKIGF